MKKVLALVLVLAIVMMAAAPAFAQKVSSKGASATAYKKASDELNKLYNQILEEYSEDPLFKTSLEKAELAWINFRDAQLEFLLPGNKVTAGEESPSLQYWISMKELTEAHIAQLRIRLMELNRIRSTGEE